MQDVEAGLQRKVVLDQLQLIRLRNTSPAFRGQLEITDVGPHRLHLTWHNEEATAVLDADLSESSFRITHTVPAESAVLSFP
jgi:sucrose phosphorylase